MSFNKQSRWPETLVHTKTNTPAQKKVGKEPAALTAPVSSGAKHGISSKTSVGGGRSISLSSRGGDSTGNKVGGSLKRGSRQALRLSSSRSFSSLHTSSLTAAPFMRSSRSLSRLDQRSTGDDSHQASSQVKKSQPTGTKILNSGQRSSSEEQMRSKKDECHGDNAEIMKTSSSPQPLDSSLVPTAACLHHCNKGKNQTRDGVYTLCAMTAGMRSNWVQAVLKNVRPSVTQDTTSSLSEQETELLQELRTADRTEVSHEQQQKQEPKLQLERKQSSADGNLSSPLPDSSSASSESSPTSPPHHVDEDEGAHQCLIRSTQIAMTDASLHVKGTQSDSSNSTEVLHNDKCFDEDPNTQSTIKHVETTTHREEQQVSTTTANTEDKETLQCEQKTGQLVKELEQTQKELSRLQQLNRNLQDELQQERESHSRFCPQNGTSSSPEQASALQQLQKINHNLRLEVEAQKRSHEEAREAELRRRIDLVAQQAQLLVTGDATALAQAHLEQDRRRFQEQQQEWEQCVALLKSQLKISEEQRREKESRLTQLQQELQSYQSLQEEAEQLRINLQEVSAQLHDYEDAQAQKEARLQKHLTLLQASQERERRSLAASLAQAEKHSQDLQEKLDKAEQQVENLSKSQTWTREIEEAQQQLQEELTCTVSAVQRLQEEREQDKHHCQELQNQLSEADREVSRLQGRLKTDETHYYNLEHSYERACEELQVALGKVQQRESETQEIREGYERLLDRKEQELSEVLLKMEVLGNSLEETELKLNELMKVCNCGSSQQKDETSEYLQHNDRLQQTTEPNESRTEVMESCQMSDSSHKDSRRRSRSVDASYQYIVTAGDGPERFMSVIQLLETKLYLTEEKLRNITQRLEEHQTPISCQDPHLCSQLTQSRATAQHLSLLLHSQAKQNHRFAQETENRCRMLVGRFQVALNIIQACRERLQAPAINIPDFERQLATVVACLQQGEKDAEKQQHESYNASRGEGKILNDEKLAESTKSDTQPSADDILSIEKWLKRELFVVEKMMSVLQSQCGVFQLSFVSKENEGDVTHRYKNIITQRIALKREERIQSGRTDCVSDETLQSAINRVCAEAELIYAALKFQQQYENVTQVNNQELQREGLADISPPELAHYEEPVDGLKEAAKPVKSEDKEVDSEKELDWLQRLISRLQRRAKFLRQVCQEIPDDKRAVSECSQDHSVENASALELNYMQEQAKLIYLSDRLYLDLEQEIQQSETLQNKLQSLCKEQDMNLLDEQEACNQTLCQLQEDNSELREELERAEQKIITVQTGNQRLLEDIQKIEDFHEERMQKLEADFQEKIRELQQIHEEEMKHLHGHYIESCVSKEKSPCFTENTSHLPDQSSILKLGGDAVAMREAYQKDMEKLQASCDKGFAAMEETHRKLIGDLNQQHQKEVAELQREKDQLLQEETAATMAAIVAMRRAHKQELERSRQSQHIRESSDFTQLHIEYEKEIQLLQKELEVLSVQHTKKCLENNQLSQELQDERKSLVLYQNENQELRKKQRDTDEMSPLHFTLNGKQSHVDSSYEMEVILRAREAEMQFLRHEAQSLREELKIARMDKIYAQSKLQALYTNSQSEAHQHDENFKFGTWSPNKDASGQSHENPAINSHSSAFLKKAEKSYLLRQIRGVRSKSLKEGLSIQERMKLFESF
ncbi:trichohyalin-like [Amphiprion ocellaris]|uniref:PH domain-containing protein n=1 Tax=Amphiprion ocellaris TaxID=80972 RepID=A0AAQ5ZRA5_AMPOC|nr:trichohyalin-like [Amphiprion ocellaris]